MTSRNQKRKTSRCSSRILQISINKTEASEQKVIEDFNHQVDEKFKVGNERTKFDVSKLFLPSKPFLRPIYIKNLDAEGKPVNK